MNFAVVTIMIGYFPPPVGPKPPEVPGYTIPTTNDTSQYQKQYDSYTKAQTTYKVKQKKFVQDKIIPYAKNIAISYLVFSITFEVLGVIIYKFASKLVGAAYVFSVIWAILVSPFASVSFFVNTLVSSLGSQTQIDYNADSIFQAVGITSVFGVAVLTVLGIIFFPRKKKIISVQFGPTNPQTTPSSPLA